MSNNPRNDRYYNQPIDSIRSNNNDSKKGEIYVSQIPIQNTEPNEYSQRNVRNKQIQRYVSGYSEYSMGYQPNEINSHSTPIRFQLPAAKSVQEMYLEPEIGVAVSLPRGIPVQSQKYAGIQKPQKLRDIPQPPPPIKPRKMMGFKSNYVHAPAIGEMITLTSKGMNNPRIQIDEYQHEIVQPEYYNNRQQQRYKNVAARRRDIRNPDEMLIKFQQVANNNGMNNIVTTVPNKSKTSLSLENIDKPTGGADERLDSDKYPHLGPPEKKRTCMYCCIPTRRKSRIICLSITLLFFIALGAVGFFLLPRIQI